MSKPVIKKLTYPTQTLLAAHRTYKKLESKAWEYGVEVRRGDPDGHRRTVVVKGPDDASVDTFIRDARRFTSEVFVSGYLW